MLDYALTVVLFVAACWLVADIANELVTDQWKP